MELENNYYHNCRFVYHSYCTDYLSNRSIAAVESRVVLFTTNEMSRVDSSRETLFVWVSTIYIIIWLLCQIYLKFGRAENQSLFILPFLQNTCKKCKFYNANPYLKCALHPSLVLTKQAQNCIDYCGK